MAQTRARTIYKSLENTDDIQMKPRYAWPWRHNVAVVLCNATDDLSRFIDSSCLSRNVLASSKVCGHIYHSWEGTPTAHLSNRLHKNGVWNPKSSVTWVVVFVVGLTWSVSISDSVCFVTYFICPFFPQSERGGFWFDLRMGHLFSTLE